MSDYITSIFDIKLLILGFTIFVLSLLEMKNANIIKTIFQKYIFQNQNTGPIIEIEDVRNICNEDDDFKYLFDSHFTGILGGSYSLINNTIKPCGKDDQDCFNLHSIPRTPLKAWYDKVICVKRMEMNETNYKIVNNNSECQEGYKNCGLYNNFGDIFCTKSDIECPITYVKFTNDKKDLDNLDLNIYKLIFLAHDYYLIYSNKLSNLTIPVDFEISENYPCLIKNRISYNESYPYFPTTNNSQLMGCRIKENVKTYKDSDSYDERYQIYATESKREVLEDNDLFNKYYKLPTLPEWTHDYDENKYHIFVRGYISLNFSCTEYDTNINFKLNLESLKITIFNQLIISLLNVLFLLIFISILSLFKLFKSWIKLFIRFLKISGSIIFLSFIFNKKEKSDLIMNGIEEYVELMNKCGDNYMIKGLEIYDIEKDMNDFIYMKNTLSLFCLISGITIGCLLICLIYKIYVRIKNKKKRIIANQELGHGTSSFFNDTVSIPFKLHKGVNSKIS